MTRQSLSSRLLGASLPMVRKRIFPEAWLEAGDDRQRLIEVAQKRRAFDGPRPDLVLGRRWDRATTMVDRRPLHLLTPRGGSTGRVLFYCHGGAFVVGPSAGEWLFAARLASALRCDLALLDYPKVPEVDSLAIRSATTTAWRQIGDRYPADRQLIAGTSAGGGLAVSTLLQAWRDGQTMPRVAILVSPWLDMTVSHPEVAAFEQSDKLLRLDPLRRDGELYAGDIDSRNPLVSPRFAGPNQLAQLPPVLVAAGEHELLLPEAREFVANVTHAGTPAELLVEKFGQHAGVLVSTPEGRTVFETLVGAARSHLE